VTTRLALHGFTGSPHSWDFVPRMTGEQWLTPALVGHAQSQAEASVSHFEHEVARLAALAESAGRVTLIGYSLGARLALGVALAAPHAVERLLLISGHFGLDSAADQEQRRAADAAWVELLQVRGLAEFVAAWEAQPLWATQRHLPAAIRQRKHAERMSHDALGLARSLRVTGLAEMPSYRARLPEIRIPTTIVAGALDRKFCDLGRVLTAAIPQATLELVPEAGHDLLLERPELITEVIRRGS